MTITTIITGFAVPLSISGLVVSLRVLISPEQRTQSGNPATLCLLCSVIYFAMFICWAAEKAEAKDIPAPWPQTEATPD
jgi:hypothetical protein